MDTKVCPTCSGAGKQYQREGGFKVTTTCPTCKGKCFLPIDHPAFSSTSTPAGASVDRP